MLHRVEARKLCQLAETEPRLAGWYNDNMRVTSSSGQVIVRVPRLIVEFDPEPRMFNEASVLSCLNDLELPVPIVLFSSSHFQIHQHIGGRPLSFSHPDGSLVPEIALTTISQIQNSLGTVDRDRIRLLGPSKRYYSERYMSCNGFSQQLRLWLSSVYSKSTNLAKSVLAEVGVTENPFKQPCILTNSSRNLRLCHGDLGRGNCLWDENNLFLIDWELALWGDPAWELASYLHRFVLHDRQESLAISMHVESQPEALVEAFLKDMSLYRTQEIDRSVVIDGIRLTDAWGEYDSSLILEYVEKVSRLKGSPSSCNIIAARIIGLLNRSSEKEISPYTNRC